MTNTITEIGWRAAVKAKIDGVAFHQAASSSVVLPAPRMMIEAALSVVANGEQVDHELIVNVPALIELRLM